MVVGGVVGVLRVVRVAELGQAFTFKKGTTEDCSALLQQNQTRQDYWLPQILLQTCPRMRGLLREALKETQINSAESESGISLLGRERSAWSSGRPLKT
jgi:hypothetical protein